MEEDRRTITFARLADQRNEISLLPDEFVLKSADKDLLEMRVIDNGVHVVNHSSDQELVLYHSHDIEIGQGAKGCKFVFEGEALKGGGGCLFVNGTNPVPIGSVACMELTPPVMLSFTIRIPGDAEFIIRKMCVKMIEELPDLTQDVSTDADVLVITPQYPSSENLYVCAFAHCRNLEYAKDGLKIQVASIGNTWYQTIYTQDGIPVFKGTYGDLKKLLSRHQFKVIVTHFVDELLYPIFDGYVTNNEQLIFICHNPEILFREIPEAAVPYFTKPKPHMDVSTQFDLKEYYVRRYAQKDNVEWCFVVDWQRQEAREKFGLEFKHSHVIHNVINEKLFPYVEKKAEDRKKILILRRFDNVSYHAVDLAVLTILELSRRPFFNDLEIEVYGDGNYYDVLTAPIRNIPNVHLHKCFVPNHKIHELHARNGIMLIPSRFDSQAVSANEAAASGLVVVENPMGWLPEILQQDVNHTIAAPDDTIGLADIIERLYYNPEEYLAISKRMSENVIAHCNTAQTTGREITLIREKLAAFRPEPSISVRRSPEQPVLTIVVPAYNVEKYIDKCLYSLLNHRNAGKMEILVINDGSKDRTGELARRYVALSDGVVRVIDKENGGHGSTINRGIQEAKGKYFRLVDGDDWVDSENLARLVDILENSDVDLVLTKGSYEYIDQATLESVIDYDMLREGVIYHFDDLVYEGYGFTGYGPILVSSNYKTELLRKADFHISEKKPYVDMEFNSFSLKYINTLVYHELDIYRYLMGREGQTVSPAFWKKKYQDHRSVIMNILQTIDGDPAYSAKKKYIYEHLLCAMIDSQVFMFDQVCKLDELEVFLSELDQWPDAKKAAIRYIEKTNGASWKILGNYRKALAIKREKPIIKGEGVVSGLKQNNGPAPIKHDLKWFAKKSIKAILPYGVLKLLHRV